MSGDGECPCECKACEMARQRAFEAGLAAKRPAPLGYVWRNPMNGEESLLHPADVTVVYPDHGGDET